MKSGYTACSLYDPATGTVVQFNNIANLNCVRKPLEVDKNPMGQTIYSSDDSLLEVEAFGFAGAAQLQAWYEGRTKLQFVAAGVEQHVQWYDSTTLDYLDIRTPARVGGRNTVAFQMSKKGHGKHQVFKNVNLLAYLGWKDTNADGLPDGYTNAGLTGLSFNAGTGSFTATADALNDRIFASVPFPIQGVPVTLSMEAVDLLAGGTLQLQIVAQSFANADLATGALTMPSVARHAVTIPPTPAGMYFLGVRPPVATAIGASDAFTARYPALRLDGSNLYVPY